MSAVSHVQPRPSVAPDGSPAAPTTADAARAQAGPAAVAPEVEGVPSGQSLLTGGRHPLDVDRSAPDAAAQVAGLVRELALGWPVPVAGSAAATWRALAALGRADLTVARLVEGHVDALRILHEAGLAPRPGAVYGVWASASGGTGLTAVPQDDGWRVDGTMRYCSGAWFIDRALVVIATPEGNRLVDVDVRAGQSPAGQPGDELSNDGPSSGGASVEGPLIRDDESWPAVGMDVTRSVDLAVAGLRVRAGDAVGGPGFYVDRPGFAAGGAGVAAVWLGGAAGVLDALVATLAAGTRAGRPPSPHQSAHLGAMAVALAGADATLAELAARLDPDSRELPGGWADAVATRTAVELAVETVLQRAPRLSGPTPLCRDAAFAHRLADLQVYVRQHHAEADYEYLGAALLESGTLLGRAFG